MTESRKRAVLGSESLDFPSIAAGETAELAFAANTHYGNARAGDAVALGPPANLPQGLMATAYVDSAGDIIVRLHNSTAGAIDPPAGAVDEVQNITHNHTGGTFTVSFVGSAESVAIDWNAIASVVDTALIALTGITAVSVVENATGDWDITFDDPGSSDLPLLVIETDSLTGGSTIDVTEVTKGATAEDALWSFALII